MISVTEAKNILLAHTPSPRVIPLPLARAAGMILARDVKSPVNSPPFDQSAMDGYAFAFRSLDHSQTFTVFETIAAGKTSHRKILKGQAVRIFTGAPLPDGADTVVMQEKVYEGLAKNTVTLNDDSIKKGSNVRLRSSQLAKNKVALQKGSVLSPAAIAFLSSLGIVTVYVYAKPVVGILVTGSELATPGKPLLPGQVYECNGAGLTAALQLIHCQPGYVYRAGDHEKKLTAALKKMLVSCDIILVTGGVSAGDYDYVVPVLNACGVKQLFHKVKQKPGKPFYAGMKNKKMVFGLPGNPASVLTCFYAYVLDFISRLTKISYLKEAQIPLAMDFQKKPGLTQFLKGNRQNGEVVILPDQESYKLNSFALANCLVVLPEEESLFLKGQEVQVLVFPD